MKRTNRFTRPGLVLAAVAVALLSVTAAGAQSNRQADGELITPPTTVPIAEMEQEAQSYSIRLAILDGIAIVDGSGVDAQFQNAARSTLEARCSGQPDGLSPRGTTPAREAASRILSSLGCEVSVMAVTIEDDGTSSGVIAVLDSKAVAELQAAVGEGIEVEVDWSD